MTEQLYAITGATGTLGSHIAEQLTEQGKPVRALVRRGSDRQFLSGLGCELVEGDLSDPRAARALVSGASHVFHCAAKTDNWGKWSEYERGNIVTTRNVVDACREQPQIQRLTHLSSIAVYGHPSPAKGQLIDETAELGQHPWLWDYYGRSKQESEKIVSELGQRSTIIRPTSFFGVRDMDFLPRLMRTIRKEGMWLFGPADNLQNLLYVGDVATLAIKAAATDRAAGQTYNGCTSGDMTQQELIERLCELLHVPPVKRRLPIWLAHRVAFGFELFGKAIGKKKTPPLTRHALSVFVRRTHFSAEKAERELGWRPSISTRDGIERTAKWLETAAPELFQAR
jgi:nucleoside-diphosphate-sugar epimerase